MAGENSIYSMLESAVANNSDERIIKALNEILSDKQNVNLTNISVIKILLKSNNLEIVKLVCEAIAESAKITEKRLLLTDIEIVKPLLMLMDKVNDDVLCLTQICRALGNLCYDNEKGRQFISNSSRTSDGHDELFKLLSLIEKNINSNHQVLLNILCGFLLNYLMSNESAQKYALKDRQILNLIQTILRNKIPQFKNNEDLITNVLLILNVLMEVFIDDRFDDELILDLVKILKISVNPEISEICLELLHSQAENDDVKLLLSKNGLCELLFQLLEQHKSLVKDEESRALMKLACDLIVLVLTEDESMTYLYDNGKGKVYHYMLSWLKSEEDIDLQTTGVLAIGNFARNDLHCIQMVENGVAESLLRILTQHNNPEKGEIRLQHALLSALRNLVIPSANKQRVLQQGRLVDIVYPLLNTEQQPVIFKLLGTLRMAVDKQEETAVNLLTRSDFMDKLTLWSSNSDHPGVRAEAPRLLAWLIKHCRCSNVLPQVVKNAAGVRSLVEMIPSSHTVMQIEALLALNLLVLSSNEAASILAPSLVDADFAKCVEFLLNKCNDKLESEVLSNLLQLLEFMIKQKIFVQHLKDTKFTDSLEKIQDKFPQYQKKINYLCCSIDSG